jgi:hypothetical protein
MEILQIWQLQSVNVVAAQDVNSVFLLYVILCFIIKRPVFLLAFLIPEFMVNAAIFDFMTEGQLYAIEIILYSYVFFKCSTDRSKVFCIGIMLTAVVFGYDSAFYGKNGYYGENQTAIYQNIEYINLCAHILFICSFISIKRIRDNLRSFFNAVMRSAANSDYVLYLRYNINKILYG